MKTVILAGGLGTRIAEETELKPKPMVEIGGRPLLWHLLHLYSSQGFADFVIACGYRGDVIKRYFHELSVQDADWYVDLATGARTPIRSSVPQWRVHVIDTGVDTMTGGRLLRLRDVIAGERFMVTYGDGLSNVDLRALVRFHEAHGKSATVTAVRPPARFGAMELRGDAVATFSEKPQVGEGWINGGFFVFEPSVLDFIDGESVPLERAPLERLARAGELMAFRHEGFWQPMDTLREKRLLEDLWSSGVAPWHAST